MCTVTYVPKKEGFFLTSNRDEHKQRKNSILPCKYPIQSGTILYPKDPTKMGTWIAAKSNGNIIVLLNGAFIKHDPPSFTSKSRGLVVLEIIRSLDPISTYGSLNLLGVEPFTIILFSKETLFKCTWNGLGKYQEKLDKYNGYIWSSVTLYDLITREKREAWFENFLHNQDPKNADSILAFHLQAGSNDPKDSLIRNPDGEIITKSITQLEVNSKDIIMRHLDLENDFRSIEELPLEEDIYNV